MPIDLHRLVVFGHVAGVIGVFAALTIEWISLRTLMGAETYEEARQGFALSPLLQRVAIPSFLVVLSSGIYLGTSLGAWELTWVAVAVPTLVLVAVVGRVIGRRLDRVRAATAAGRGPLPNGVRLKARDPLLLGSWRFRTALLVGLVVEMTTKPDYAGVLLIVAAGLVGIAWAALAWTVQERHRQQEVL
jgi:hypothetical protein